MGMNEKKTFGAYILRRRKELGMTQKEFAQKLFVTESAVSKWERGMSYPDITLLRPICAVLEITEHELLTGSEDSEKRTAQHLAQKYLTAAKRWRIAQYIFYCAIISGCFLGNILSEHTLDWFWIALTACMTAASITLAPSIFSMKPETERFAVVLSAACFTVSLVLLLIAGCAYSGGKWYFVGITGSLLGITALVLPFILPKIPLGAFWQNKKTSVWLLVNTVLLILLLLASCIYSGGEWFALASAGTLLGLGFVIWPILLRQMPVPKEIRRHNMLMIFCVQTILLYAVLFLADRYSGAGVFLRVSVPVSLVSLALPWGTMLVLRYLPAPTQVRAAAAVFVGAAWLRLFPLAIRRILVNTLALEYGQISVPQKHLNIITGALCAAAAFLIFLHLSRKK